MQAFALLDVREYSTNSQDDGSNGYGWKETRGYIDNKKRKNCATGSTGCPVDVASLESKELQGALKPLEDWIVIV